MDSGVETSRPSAPATEAGHDRLVEAAETLIADVERVFAAHFTPAELAVLARLLGRLTEGDGDDCAPG